jgi:hypothetical protein
MRHAAPGAVPGAANRIAAVVSVSLENKPERHVERDGAALLHGGTEVPFPNRVKRGLIQCFDAGAFHHINAGGNPGFRNVDQNDNRTMLAAHGRLRGKDRRPIAKPVIRARWQHLAAKDISVGLAFGACKVDDRASLRLRRRRRFRGWLRVRRQVRFGRSRWRCNDRRRRRFVGIPRHQRSGDRIGGGRRICSLRRLLFRRFGWLLRPGLLRPGLLGLGRCGLGLRLLTGLARDGTLLLHHQQFHGALLLRRGVAGQNPRQQHDQ